LLTKRADAVGRGQLICILYLDTASAEFSFGVRYNVSVELLKRRNSGHNHSLNGLDSVKALFLYELLIALRRFHGLKPEINKKSVT
jgi:hypothetical protein